MMSKTLTLLMHSLGQLGTAPEWVHLAPPGTFSGADGRGPFIADEQAILAAAANRKLPIDVNHAIDLKGAQGEEAPAVGWIVELQSRPSGIWGRVEWTQAGSTLLSDKAYGFISPVLMTTETKPYRVVAIARASLCNDPNLTQLTSLHTKHGDAAMDKDLRAALGLPDNASDATVLEAVKTVHAAAAAHTELMTSLRKAAGGDENADAATLITSLQSRANSEKSDLEKVVSTLQSELMSVRNTQARDRAEAAIGNALEEGRLVPALKEHMITRHMKEPEAVEKELAAMPSLMSGGLKGYRPAENRDGLSDDDRRVCVLMGVDPAKFAEAKKKELL